MGMKGITMLFSLKNKSIKNEKGAMLINCVVELINCFTIVKEMTKKSLIILNINSRKEKCQN